MRIYDRSSAENRIIRHTGTISREVFFAITPTRLGMTAPPRPVKAIWKPMVFDVNASPTRWVVPDIRAGKIGAMARPISTTAIRFASSKGFHQRRSVPRRARMVPEKMIFFPPMRCVMNPAISRPMVNIAQKPLVKNPAVWVEMPRASVRKL